MSTRGFRSLRRGILNYESEEDYIEEYEPPKKQASGQPPAFLAKVVFKIRFSKFYFYYFNKFNFNRRLF